VERIDAAIAKQRRGKHVSAATVTEARIEDAMFFMQSVSRLHKEDQLDKPVTLTMDCYLDVVGGLVPLRFEEGRPKAVRDKVAGKGQQQYY
jgi:hypothetical protein